MVQYKQKWIRFNFFKNTNITNPIVVIFASYKAYWSLLLTEYRYVFYPLRTNEAQGIPLIRLLDLIDTTQNRLGNRLSGTVDINVLITYSNTKLLIIWNGFIKVINKQIKMAVSLQSTHVSHRTSNGIVETWVG